MPALRARMHVTPSETSLLLLLELSKLTGKGAATIVRELLDEAIPALEMSVQLMRDAKRRPEQVQAAMARYSARAINGLTQAQLDLDSAREKKRGPKPKQGRGAAKTG